MPTLKPNDLKQRTADLLRSGKIDELTALSLGLVINASTAHEPSLMRIAQALDDIENPPPSSAGRVSMAVHDIVSSLIKDLSLS